MTGTAVTPTQQPAQDVVARGLQAYSAMASENDALRRENEQLRYAARCDRVEIEAVNARLNALQSDHEITLAERDQAVADRALYEAMFASFRAQLDAFEVPSTPTSPRVRKAANGRRRIADQVVAAGVAAAGTA